MNNDILAQLLQAKSDWLNEQLNSKLQQQGCSLTPAQQTVFNLAFEQVTTLSQLAQQMRVSRQAVQKTVASLVELELIQLRTCPENGAAKVLIVTARGQLMRLKYQQVRRDIEAQLLQRLGPEQVAILKQILQQQW
ncbi:MarR family winged helix-turn-helix transcriptional regulator [Motilimonas pumila]|uniref:MarR family transcriptional regulator n=1 Tax=Motilimonas pumila TaxID=2303987 RepID=A0A418YH39_9GAMM|nr:MarR family transcriptional regulator [Motilimonas pumila]RJG49400.1 MarR family transcriptional regulator [Motilimonas pumila]